MFINKLFCLFFSVYIISYYNHFLRSKFLLLIIFLSGFAGFVSCAGGMVQ